MKKQRKINSRILIFAVIFIIAVIGSYHSLRQDKGARLRLGLDLKGGLYLLLGVDTYESVKRKVKSISSDLQFYVNDKGLSVNNIAMKGDRAFSFKIKNKSEYDGVEKYLMNSSNGLEVKLQKDGSYLVNFTQREINLIRRTSIRQTVQIIRDRLNKFGLSEPTVVMQGDDKIVVELPGVSSPEEEARAKKLIGKAAYLEFLAVDETATKNSDGVKVPKGDKILFDSVGRRYIVKSISVLDGTKLTDANVGFNKNNQPVINFSLDTTGAKIFGEFTGKNVGKRLAIVLDNVVYSAPVINERIGGGSGQISGDYTVKDANDLVIALKSGSLTSKIDVLEERSIGPSLGADSIKTSFIALIVGFLVVILFMMIYYGISGIFAVIALIGNLFIIIAIMALFKATLTLPGIAGLILTIGMAVDANVIIIERIREFLKDGVLAEKSVKEGYMNAFSAIIDSNVTTLIAAFILFGYGTGPIKGFAITMSIGIFISMFTSIFVTKGFYAPFSKKIKKEKYNLWFGIKG